ESQICLGDRFQMGELLLEVTQPRSPCWKLGQHACIQDNWTLSSFLHTYSKEGYVGFYCRVLSSGTAQAGQPITWLPYQGSNKTLTIQALFLAKQHYQTVQDQQQLQIAIKHPALSSAWKNSLKSQLTRPLNPLK
ncbi:MAG TPA: MOSC domain-containing protein, partial [Thiomicrorhabdus sp.]|nr:MOSC domain-containing protein [Thiomicrorhabdus sp.]